MGELDNLLLTYSRSKFGPLDSVYLMLWKIKGFLYALNGVSMDYTLNFEVLTLAALPCGVSGSSGGRGWQT